MLLWKEQRNGVASGGWWEVCFILPWHVIAIYLFADGKMIVEGKLMERKREKTIADRILCAASFWGFRFFFISRKGQLFCLQILHLLSSQKTFTPEFIIGYILDLISLSFISLNFSSNFKFVFSLFAICWVISSALPSG